MLDEYKKFKPDNEYSSSYCAHIVWASMKQGDIVPLPKKKGCESGFGTFIKYSRKVKHIEAHDNVICESPIITKHIKEYDLISYTSYFDVAGKRTSYTCVVGGWNPCINLWEGLISGFWNIDVDINICWKPMVGDLRNILERENLKGIACFKHGLI